MSLPPAPCVRGQQAASNGKRATAFGLRRGVGVVCSKHTLSARSAMQGFTLIEVLVALAIVTITLATGIKAAGALVQNGQRLAEVSAAQWCADNALAGLKLARQYPGVGDIDFSCEQLGASYRGKLVVRPTLNPNFRRVEALLDGADGQPLYSLTTLVARQ